MNRYSRGCLFLLLVAVAGLFVFCVVWPTVQLLQERSQISALLTHAQGVELVHYREFPGREAVYADKKLDHSQFKQVIAAFPLRLDAGVPGLEMMCLFNPHHKIVITGEDGRQTVIRVCFQCDHVKIGDAEPFGTPYAWRGALHDFFAREGMANDPALYRRDRN